MHQYLYIHTCPNSIYLSKVSKINDKIQINIHQQEIEFILNYLQKKIKACMKKRTHSDHNNDEPIMKIRKI